MEKTKLLFVTSSFPINDKDTSGIFIYKLAEAIKKTGIEIDVIAPDYKGTRTNRIGNINVIPLKYCFNFLEILAPPGGGTVNAVRKNPFLFILIPLYYFFLVLKLLFIQKKYNGIVFFWFWNALPLLFFKKICRKSLVATYGSDFQIFLSDSLLKNIYIKVLSKFKAVVTDNPYTQSLIPFSKFVFMGVDILNIEKVESRFDRYILFCGALTENKGIEDLLEVFLQLKKHNVNLIIVGDGPLRDYVNNFISENKLEDNIECIYSILQKKLFYLMKNALLFILPSKHEGTPNVILESIVMGTPFLTYDIPQLRYLFNEDSKFFLVEKNNKAALKKRIEDLILCPELREEQKEIEKKWLAINNISWANTANNYLNILLR